MKKNFSEPSSGTVSTPIITFSEARSSKASQTEKQLLDGLRHEFDIQFTNLEAKRATELSAETKEIIGFVQGRIEEWTENRTSSIQVALGIFAFSIAGLAMLSDPSKTPWYVYPVALPFLCGLLTTTLTQFVIISRQVSFRYPFVGVSKTWRWFYLYNVSNKMPFKTRLGEAERAKSRRLFLEGLTQYARETLQLEPSSDLKQNLEQLYLLLVYEGYIVRFAISANNVLRKGIIGSVVGSILLGGVIILGKLFWH